MQWSFCNLCKYQITMSYTWNEYSLINQFCINKKYILKTSFLLSLLFELRHISTWTALSIFLWNVVSRSTSSFQRFLVFTIMPQKHFSCSFGVSLQGSQLIILMLDYPQFPSPFTLLLLCLYFCVHYDDLKNFSIPVM